MRFIILTVLSAYIVLAVFARPFPSRLNGEELWERDSSSCDGQTMKTCATALAPSVATCGLAAAQGELDVVNDAACIGAAVELGKDLVSYRCAQDAASSKQTTSPAFFLYGLCEEIWKRSENIGT
ncbi:hypothetical protein F5880DRAFT_1607463 [Lentinula raphanica]|nr:hypothetical protein F5880DRAFT_1607463 [Lentinula raphanica]